MTESATNASESPPQIPRNIRWYRSKLDTATRKAVMEKSDILGFLQAGGHLFVIAVTGGTAFWAAQESLWGWFAVLTFVHGTVSAFAINAVHELVHGTVFRPRWLNRAWAYPFAFLGWINHEQFWQSHTRHHRFTLHDPHDQEVVLPIKIAIRDFFRCGFFDVAEFWRKVRTTFLASLGRFGEGWPSRVLGSRDSKEHRAAVRWARLLLGGHGAIFLVSLATGEWVLSVLISATPVYGKWLFFLCNNSQHTGLVDDVPDFRLCCRTIRLGPLTQFLYWHMNYHTEHHMYASVPCYRLGKLHRAIRHDLPPSKGLMGCWREILEIGRRQDRDPNYQYYQSLPPTATPAVWGDKRRD